MDKPCTIIRPVSLRLQDEGQKNAHGLSDATESLTRIFFLTFCFLMQRDSKRICKRYRLRLLRFRLSFDMPLSCNIYCPKESKCRHLQNPSKIPLSCQGTIKIKVKSKFKSKRKIKKRIRVKDSVVGHP